MEPIPIIGPVCSDLGGNIRHFHTTIVRIHVDTVIDKHVCLNRTHKHVLAVLWKYLTNTLPCKTDSNANSSS